MRKTRRSAWLAIVVIALACAILGLDDVVTPPVAAAGQANPGVALRVVPAAARQTIGDIFDLTLILDNDHQPIDGGELHLMFDPARLQVTDAAGVPSSTISAGSAFDLVLENRADNSLGQIDFAAGTLGSASPPDGAPIAAVTFRAIDATGPTGSAVSFSTTGVGATTRAASNGSALPLTLTNGVVVVSETPLATSPASSD